MHLSRSEPPEARQLGAAALAEELGDDTLIEAIGAALASARNRADGFINQQALEKLSPRERQVLDLVVASKPNKIIADILGISIKTVELHRANMMAKLGVRSTPN